MSIKRKLALLLVLTLLPINALAVKRGTPIPFNALEAPADVDANTLKKRKTTETDEDQQESYTASDIQAGKADTPAEINSLSIGEDGTITYKGTKIPIRLDKKSGLLESVITEDVEKGIVETETQAKIKGEDLAAYLGLIKDGSIIPTVLTTFLERLKEITITIPDSQMGEDTSALLKKLMTESIDRKDIDTFVSTIGDRLKSLLADMMKDVKVPLSLKEPDEVMQDARRLGEALSRKFEDFTKKFDYAAGHVLSDEQIVITPEMAESIKNGTLSPQKERKLSSVKFKFNIDTGAGTGGKFNHGSQSGISVYEQAYNLLKTTKANTLTNIDMFTDSYYLQKHPESPYYPLVDPNYDWDKSDTSYASMFTEYFVNEKLPKLAKEMNPDMDGLNIPFNAERFQNIINHELMGESADDDSSKIPLISRSEEAYFGELTVEQRELMEDMTYWWIADNGEEDKFPASLKEKGYTPEKLMNEVYLMTGLEGRQSANVQEWLNAGADWIQKNLIGTSFVRDMLGVDISGAGSALYSHTKNGSNNGLPVNTAVKNAFLNSIPSFSHVNDVDFVTAQQMGLDVSGLHSYEIIVPEDINTSDLLATLSKASKAITDTSAAEMGKPTHMAPEDKQMDANVVLSSLAALEDVPGIQVLDTATGETLSIGEFATRMGILSQESCDVTMIESVEVGTGYEYAISTNGIFDGLDQNAINEIRDVMESGIYDVLSAAGINRKDAYAISANYTMIDQVTKEMIAGGDSQTLKTIIENNAGKTNENDSTYDITNFNEGVDAALASEKFQKAKETLQEKINGFREKLPARSEGIKDTQNVAIEFRGLMNIATGRKDKQTGNMTTLDLCSPTFDDEEEVIHIAYTPENMPIIEALHAKISSAGEYTGTIADLKGLIEQDYKVYDPFGGDITDRLEGMVTRCEANAPDIESRVPWLVPENSFEVLEYQVPASQFPGVDDKTAYQSEEVWGYYDGETDAKSLLQDDEVFSEEEVKKLITKDGRWVLGDGYVAQGKDETGNFLPEMMRQQTTNEEYGIDIKSGETIKFQRTEELQTALEGPGITVQDTTGAYYKLHTVNTNNMIRVFAASHGYYQFTTKDGQVLYATDKKMKEIAALPLKKLLSDLEMSPTLAENYIKDIVVKTEDGSSGVAINIDLEGLFYDYARFLTPGLDDLMTLLGVEMKPWEEYMDTFMSDPLKMIRFRTDGGDIITDFEKWGKDVYDWWKEYGDDMPSDIRDEFKDMIYTLIDIYGTEEDVDILIEQLIDDEDDDDDDDDDNDDDNDDDDNEDDDDDTIDSVEKLLKLLKELGIDISDVPAEITLDWILSKIPKEYMSDFFGRSDYTVNIYSALQKSQIQFVETDKVVPNGNTLRWSVYKDGNLSETRNAKTFGECSTVALDKEGTLIVGERNVYAIKEARVYYTSTTIITVPALNNLIIYEKTDTGKSKDGGVYSTKYSIDASRWDKVVSAYYEIDDEEAEGGQGGGGSSNGGKTGATTDVSVYDITAMIKNLYSVFGYWINGARTEYYPGSLLIKQIQKDNTFTFRVE